MKAILLFLGYHTLLSVSSALTDESGYPGGVFGEIWSLLTNGTIEHFFGCKLHDNFTNDDIGYNLYTRPYGNNSKLTLNILNELNMTKPIKMLFNGWLRPADDPRLLAMVEAYLTRYDSNVIVVDTTKLTNTEYTGGCNNIIGAELIGDFMCEMYKQGYLDFDNLHMVGLSLGAQIMGLIGQRVKQQCKQTVDRISGLDPAGPIYQGQDVSRRLDKSDAKFVDVIHTNMGMYGYYGSVGHVDFFPNCGTVQPGCISFVDIKNPLMVLLNFILIMCSHIRSALLFTESVYGPVFNATSCTSCPGNKGMGKYKVADIIKPKYAIMGEDCPRNPPATKFVLETNSKPPFKQI